MRTSYASRLTSRLLAVEKANASRFRWTFETSHCQRKHCGRVMTISSASLAPIDLFRGWPNAGLLPSRQIKAATEAALSDPTVYTPGLLYGPDNGFKPLREAVAQWLSEFYKEFAPPIAPQRISITGGASQNLACVLQACSDPLYTRRIWMVSPTYYHACRIFEDGGFFRRLKSVPEDQEGIDIDYLEKALSEGDGEEGLPGTQKPV